MLTNQDRPIAKDSVAPGPNVLALLLISLAVAAVTVVTIWTVYYQV
jgi:hypothetical protein